MLVEGFLHGQGDDDFVAANAVRGFLRGRQMILHRLRRTCHME